MSNFNHRGPDNLGPKTGMKLGKCRKNKFEITGDAEITYCKRRQQRKLLGLENDN
ncbi:hypothetical protein [Winogradskyella helgolandensis]|uniref:hypothetical protein n=1 Tax=Winogradskyella helgolandensis TaxID=2697010 RepID=UPI0015BB7336|nr:hypothetical protein [Winogradskyella helgolandensis]